MDESGANPSGTLSTIETAFEFLESIKAHERVGVSTLADEHEMAKGTAHGYLKTLESMGYIKKKDGEYTVSLKFLDLGAYARSLNPAHKVVEQKAHELADETGERCTYFIEEMGRAIVLYRARGASAVETDIRVGSRMYLHMPAGGKAILAHLPSERIDAIVDGCGLPGKTGSSITDRSELKTELETIRERGYAVNREEHIEDLRAYSVPLLNESDEVLGALSISGPTNRLQNESYANELVELLLGTMNEIKLNITYA